MYGNFFVYHSNHPNKWKLCYYQFSWICRFGWSYRNNDTFGILNIATITPPLVGICCVHISRNLPNDKKMVKRAESDYWLVLPY